MSPRERRLLVVLALVVLAAAVLGATSALLDRWEAQDRALAQAKRAVRQALDHPVQPASSEPQEGLFLPKDETASAGSFAQTMGQLFRRSGLEVREFQILEETGDRLRIRYSLRGQAASWLRALSEGQQLRPHPLYNNVGIHLREGSLYDVSLEVGYARAP